MRTIVYIDGLNLFYGALKGTDYKWLDLAAFVESILPRDCRLAEIKYFTALVRGNTEGRTAQEIYLNALRLRSPKIDISEGHFTRKTVRGRVGSGEKSEFAIVHTFEEKCTDVDLAIAIVADVMENRCDCVALLSNDGDLRGALRFARERGKQTLFIPPIKYGVNKKLLEQTTRRLDYPLMPRDFRRAQLPPRVGKHSKPRHWGGSENE